MTTEKEFWNLAGQYFRKELGINEDEQSTDEGCVGCCKVVDIAAKLQEELDECNERCTLLGSHNMQITANLLDRKATIEELKDSNIEDLKELYDFHEGELEWFNDVISGLKAELGISKGVVTAKDIHIAGLKDELSARKEDSEVLMEVVEIIRDDTIPNSKVPCMICNLVDAYLDAPEGPPEIPIDESDVLKKIRVLVDDWSVNKKGGKQSFFILSEIDDMLKSTQHIDETQDITVTFAFLELP